MADDSDHVFNRDPRHPLLPAAETTSNAELERREHFRKRATFSGKYDSEAQHDGTDAHGSRAAGFGFPVTANQCEEVRSVGARFGENFVTSVAVVSDCRGDNERLWFLVQPRKRIYEDASSVDAAAAKQLLAFFGPAAVGDSRAAKVDHYIDALEARYVNRCPHRIPLDVPGIWRFTGANEANHVVAVGLQRCRGCAADQTRASGNKNLHVLYFLLLRPRNLP